MPLVHLFDNWWQYAHWQLVFTSNEERYQNIQDGRDWGPARIICLKPFLITIMIDKKYACMSFLNVYKTSAFQLQVWGAGSVPSTLVQRYLLFSLQMALQYFSGNKGCQCNASKITFIEAGPNFSKMTHNSINSDILLTCVFRDTDKL